MTVQHLQHSTSTRSRRRRTLRSMVISGILLVSLAACTRGTQGIFATIEQEEKISTNNLVDDVSIRGLVRATIGGENRFVALAGTKIFSRSESSNDWFEISAPDRRLAQHIGGIDADSDGYVEEVYVIFQNRGDNETDLYALQSDLGWNAISLSGVDGNDTLAGLVAVGDRLLMSVRDANSTESEIPIVRLQSGSTVVDTITGFNDIVRDAIVDDTGDLYIVGSSFQIARVDSGATVAVSIVDDIPAQAVSGIGYRSAADGGALIAVVDMNANVHLSDGTDWETITNAPDRAFSDIEWIPEIGSSGAFVVGTWRRRRREDASPDGYYHALITAGSSIADFEFSFEDDLGSNYRGSELSRASIDSFRYFGNGLLFVLTNGDGLWRTTYISGATEPGDFTQE